MPTETKYQQELAKGRKYLSWSMSPEEQALLAELRSLVAGTIPAIIKLHEVDFMRFALDYTVKGLRNELGNR